MVINVEKNVNCENNGQLKFLLAHNDKPSVVGISRPFLSTQINFYMDMDK